MSFGLHVPCVYLRGLEKREPKSTPMRLLKDPEMERVCTLLKVIRYICPKARVHILTFDVERSCLVRWISCFGVASCMSCASRAEKRIATEAPNYLDTGNNKGAFLKLTRP